MCGCDYTTSRIKGIGPKRAHEIIQKYHSIAEYIKTLEADKQPDLATFLFQEAAAEFQNPNVMLPEEAKKLLVWRPAQKDALLKFLVDEKQFRK